DDASDRAKKFYGLM
uniref:Ranamargarin n=1 Tax=Odorrana margaretae TaxID=121156 RepID=TKNM_ODOMA|nr:RecName: Full=Ranamargarin [Odorrana margaretae]